MNIFATGTTGTIGRHITRGAHPINIDLGNDFELPREVTDCDEFTLIHLAGKVGLQAVSQDVELAHKINVTSSRLLAEKCIEAGVRKFIYVSTSHVYQQSIQLLDENSSIYPTTKYAQQKRMAEQEILEAFKNIPERLVVARVFSILDWGTPEFTLGSAILKLLKGEISSINSGMDLRDFLTPNKVASILIEVAVRSQLSGVVNICSSNAISIAEAAGRMLTEVGKPELAQKVISENSKNPVIVGNNQKLMDALPYLDLKWIPSKLIL